MTLNPDCVRDTLFFLEDHLSINSELEFSTIDIYELDKSLDYPIGELSNTLLVLDDAGFIQSYRCDSDDRVWHGDFGKYGQTLSPTTRQ